MLDQLGLIGWGDIELTVVSAVLANIPILFVGTAGAAKTEGAHKIAQSILGDNLKWAVWECPHIQMDDIIGLPDVRSLKAGTLSFVGSPISVWNINAVVLDELTRAPQSTVGKLLEIVRTKSVFGLTTPLQYVFSTANPPSKEYTTTRLDPAMVSRFCVIPVPAFHEFSDADAEKILRAPTVQSIIWPEPSTQDCVVLTLKLRKVLSTHGIHLNGRSAKYLSKLLTQSYAAASVCKRTPHTMTQLVLSCVPEASRLCTVSVDTAALATALITFFERQFHTAVPDPKDWVAYCSALRTLSQSVSSPEEAKILVELIRKGVQTGKTADLQKIMETAVPAIIPYYPFDKILSIPEMLDLMFT